MECVIESVMELMVDMHTLHTAMCVCVCVCVYLKLFSSLFFFDIILIMMVLLFIVRPVTWQLVAPNIVVFSENVAEQGYTSVKNFIMENILKIKINP